MTTTLRPSGPEERLPGGGRSRRFEIMVNGRPAGAVAVSAEPRAGGLTGLLSGLHVDAPDRRRGRGTVAVLAAEEVLRDWGCVRVEASVPAGAGAALGTAAALGYTEGARNMIKALPAEPPALPPGSRARPLGAADYPAWSAHARAGYADSLVGAGVPRAEAEAKAVRDHAVLLPDGPDTADTALLLLSHDGTDVGHLWVRLRNAALPHEPAWVYDVEVAEEHRGRGHGRTLMLLAERVCAEAGERELKLNVFATNTPAVRLYESLGYAVTAHHFSKRLL